jgi:hypothetical protein
VKATGRAQGLSLRLISCLCKGQALSPNGQSGEESQPGGDGEQWKPRWPPQKSEQPSPACARSLRRETTTDLLSQRYEEAAGVGGKILEGVGRALSSAPSTFLRPAPPAPLSDC